MNKGLLLLILLAVAGIGAFSTFFTVRETEQAMILEFGKPLTRQVDTGLNYKIPFIQEVRYFDRRVLDFDAAAKEIPTADQKQVVVDAFTRYRIVNPLEFFQTVNNEQLLKQRLDAVIDNSLRNVLGDVPLADVLTPKRSKMMEDFTALVKEQSKGFGIDVVDVRIKRIDLPEANSKAIFDRMSSERKKEAALFRAEGEKESQSIRANADRQARVLIAEANKQSEILRGDGDAQAQAIYNDAYGKDQEFFDFWRSMQALEKGLGSSKTTYVGPPQGDFFRYFNTDNEAAQ